MYFLVRLNLDYGRKVRCVVNHLRRDASGEPVLLETLGEIALPAKEGPAVKERGVVVPANPRPGDILEFGVPEISPIGENGGGYSLEVTLCEAFGPSPDPDPLILRLAVPEQTAPDASDCPGAAIDERRARKCGDRTFRWEVQSAEAA